MDDYEEVVLLDEFSEALAGCVYDPEGNPIPCYIAEKVMEILAGEGYSLEAADEYLDLVTEGVRLIWVHPLELRPEFTPDDKKPHLRIVH